MGGGRRRYHACLPLNRLNSRARGAITRFGELPNDSTNAEKLRRNRAAPTVPGGGAHEPSRTSQGSQADIAAGTLFNYFPEKRNLLIHLMQQRLDSAMERAFAEVPPSTLEQELKEVFDALKASGIGTLR